MVHVHTSRVVDEWCGGGVVQEEVVTHFTWSVFRIHTLKMRTLTLCLLKKSVHFQNDWRQLFSHKTPFFNSV